jgi:hypothetical protein
MHAGGGSALATVNRVQRIGAQAVTGALRTVATVVAEAEACIHHSRRKMTQFIIGSTVATNVALTVLGFHTDSIIGDPFLRKPRTRVYQLMINR